MGNNLHIKTNDAVIWNNVIIRQGDMLDSNLITDNERIIRKLSFIEDARIIVNYSSANRDSVDVLIITKDLWSKGFDVKIPALDSGQVVIWENNIFGIGHQIGSDIFWNMEKSPSIGYEGIYKIENIFGTFVKGKVNYLHKFEKESYGLNLFRDFFTPNIEYAGGAELRHTSKVEKIMTTDTTSFWTHVKYNNYDFWVGRAFPIKVKSSLSGIRSTIIISARLLNNFFFKRPPIVSEQSYYQYHDKTILLGCVAFSMQNYNTSNLIYSFGRTEDIPYGSLVKITAGLENSEFFRRLYSSISFSKGNYLKNIGYYYNSLSIGGFINKRRFEQGMINCQLNYFTNLLRIKNFRLRQFANINYSIGIRRFEGDMMNINNENGIRGLRSDSLTGTQKLALNLETVAFSPFYVFGFRFAFFGFVDLGLIGSSKESIFSNDLYSGLGVGIRFRNENLVFKTFQIRFAFYPLVPQDAIKQLMYLSGEKVLAPEDFYAKAPKILLFN